MEFWTASLLLALRYACHKQTTEEGETYIAVININILSKGKRRIYHVPALYTAFEGKEMDKLDHEYLALGVFTGPGLYTIGMQRFIGNILLGLDGVGMFLALDYMSEEDCFGWKARVRMFGGRVLKEEGRGDLSLVVSFTFVFNGENVQLTYTLARIARRRSCHLLPGPRSEYLDSRLDPRIY